MFMSSHKSGIPGTGDSHFATARGTSSEGLWVSLLPPGLEQNEALCLRLHRLGLENRDRRLVLEQLFGVVCSRGDFDRLLEVPTGVDIT